jgi:hypothetical protein
MVVKSKGCRFCTPDISGGRGAGCVVRNTSVFWRKTSSRQYAPLVESPGVQVNSRGHSKWYWKSYADHYDDRRRRRFSMVPFRPVKAKDRGGGGKKDSHSSWYLWDTHQWCFGRVRVRGGGALAVQARTERRKDHRGGPHLKSITFYRL